MKDRVLHIDAPHFCAGAVMVDGVCDRAAPIIKYMVGWLEFDILVYCRRKGWGSSYHTPGRDLSDIL